MTLFCNLFIERLLYVSIPYLWAGKQTY